MKKFIYIGHVIKMCVSPCIAYNGMHKVKIDAKRTKLKDLSHKNIRPTTWQLVRKSKQGHGHSCTAS